MGRGENEKGFDPLYGPRRPRPARASAQQAPAPTSTQPVSTLIVTDENEDELFFSPVLVGGEGQEAFEDGMGEILMFVEQAYGNPSPLWTIKHDEAPYRWEIAVDLPDGRAGWFEIRSTEEPGLQP